MGRYWAHKPQTNIINANMKEFVSIPEMAFGQISRQIWRRGCGSRLRQHFLVEVGKVQELPRALCSWFLVATCNVVDLWCWLAVSISRARALQ